MNWPLRFQTVFLIAGYIAIARGVRGCALHRRNRRADGAFNAGWGSPETRLGETLM